MSFCEHFLLLLFHHRSFCEAGNPLGTQGDRRSLSGRRGEAQSGDSGDLIDGFMGVGPFER